MNKITNTDYKKILQFYKIPIPKSTKPGSRIKFKQSPPPIPNINHNAGKNPPNCPPKQRLLSVNHIPTSKEIAANRDLNRKTAKYKISNSIPRLDFSSAGIESMATRANYYRNGTTPFTSGPHGPARDTPTFGRIKERMQMQGWRNVAEGKNPLNRFKEFPKIELPKIEFPKFPTW